MAKQNVQADTPRADPADRRRAMRIYKQLEALYPDAHCALVHRNPFELLVATILSAQCTDERVNKVTPALFKKYPSPQAMSSAKVKDIEVLVKTTGFFRNKARNIHDASKLIAEEYDGQVPSTMQDLLELPGVARKTANVVLGNAFDINVGMVVDTHIGRLSRRFGFTEETDPVKIERDLMALFPSPRWTQLAHLLIFHGRNVCKARAPLCRQSAFCRRYCAVGRGEVDL